MKNPPHVIPDSQFVDENPFSEMTAGTTPDRQCRFESAEIIAYPAKKSGLASLTEKLNRYKTVHSIHLTRIEFQELLRLQSIWAEQTT